MVKMQLYVWSPALGAPSIDPKCIVIESYLRVLELDYTVVHANDPQTSPTGELPLLKHGATWIAGIDRILSYLVKQQFDANATLSPAEKADYLAYNALVQEKLYDCMLFTWYADMTNFVKSIRPTYAKLLSFPSRYFVPIQLKKTAKSRLAKYDVEIISDDTTLPENEKDEMKELQRTGWHQMYRLARETYHVLNDKLGDKKYMFGDSATTLDCIVFGYLSLHYYPDLAHNRLQHILKEEYPRLARFCDRFQQTYFSDQKDVEISEPSDDIPSLWRTMINNPRGFLSSIKDDAVQYMSSSDKKKKRSEAQLDFERKRIWSIAGGVTFLLAYIIYNGIISVEVVDEDDQYYDDDDNQDDYVYELDE
ncbi:uncharacterized protein BX664DRAFT_285339 [Halteromyces radiatus]|uniref:uncharacterized protein n=1 Tax=Halteromyces radiatus TaxID=101107 RepID=UPI002220689E|nr:uncharacterized protein BX664DRAFT_285339 [Halteromyces radiatus]KAI8081367.1 hypothetical protein BX664DRAFT_285339 [Halteromyces radiatus]